MVGPAVTYFAWRSARASGGTSRASASPASSERSSTRSTPTSPTSRRTRSAPPATGWSARRSGSASSSVRWPAVCSAAFGVQVPLFVAGAITVSTWCCAWRCCRRAWIPASDARSAGRRPTRSLSLGLLRRTPLLVALAAMLLLTNLANQGLYATWVFSTTMRFDWSTAMVGIVFAVMGVCFALSQGLLVGPVVQAARRAPQHPGRSDGQRRGLPGVRAGAGGMDGLRASSCSVPSARSTSRPPRRCCRRASTRPSRARSRVRWPACSASRPSWGRWSAPACSPTSPRANGPGRLSGRAVGLRRAAGAGRAGGGLAIREAGAPAGRGRQPELALAV